LGTLSIEVYSLIKDVEMVFEWHVVFVVLCVAQKNEFQILKKNRSWFPRFAYIWKALNDSILIDKMKIMKSFSLQAVVESLL